MYCTLPLKTEQCQFYRYEHQIIIQYNHNKHKVNLKNKNAMLNYKDLKIKSS